MTPALALYLYRALFAAFIVWASAKTYLEGWPAQHGSSENMGLFIRILAASEIVAALLFLWPRAQWIAGGALILIFAIATWIDLKHGGVPARFAYYSGTVLIVSYLSERLGATAQA
jgi:hypothetical protein